MSPTFYYILHVSSVMLLLGITFAVFGGWKDDSAARKKVLISSGIVAIVALVGGFGLASKVYSLPNPLSWPLWIWIKVLCWVVLAATGGIAFRRRENVSPLIMITLVAVLVALVAVYVKP